MSDVPLRPKDHVTVCICTFRRNEGLTRLVRSIAAQEASEAFRVSIVVVDNDPEGDAFEAVRALRQDVGVPIDYQVEPVRSIPAARNRALAMATGNYIAIIDDDEFPREDWLKTMYSAVQVFEVDGALGPVFPYFEKPAPAWLQKGQFSGAPAFRTGTLLRWQQTYTGNVLLKREVMDRHGLRFNLNYRTGGSDQEFFKQAMGAGGRFVAVEEAPVYEVVPPERWSKKYYVKRALVNGFNSQRLHREDGGAARGVVTTLKSVLAVIAYGVMLPFCVILEERAMVECLTRGGHHFSRLSALMGIELVKKRDF